MYDDTFMHIDIVDEINNKELYYQSLVGTQRERRVYIIGMLTMACFHFCPALPCIAFTLTLFHPDNAPQLPLTIQELQLSQQCVHCSSLHLSNHSQLRPGLRLGLSRDETISPFEQGGLKCLPKGLALDTCFARDLSYFGQ